MLGNRSASNCGSGSLRRWFWRRATLAGAALGAAVALAPSRAAAADCRGLNKIAIENAEIVSATAITGEFNAPFNETAGAEDGFSRSTAQLTTHVNFCRVEAIARPTAGSFIMLEIWLPENWNGRSLSTAPGKAYGAINYSALVSAVNRGFATVTSDSGHRSSRLDWTWAIGHPEKATDYFYRGTYEAERVFRKTLVAYYGKKESHSYFEGCARGGQIGLVMAERYPDLFDGIVAGSPGTDVARQQAYFMWTAMALRDPKGGIPKEKFAMISRAVMKRCDGDDGLVDGQITDPLSCAFEPRDLACDRGDGADCLTPSEVATLEKIYRGPINPRTGEMIYRAVGAKGSEVYWPSLFVDNGPAVAPKVLGPLVFGQQHWDWTSFDFDRDLDRAIIGMAEFGQNGSDLRDFARHGKILITHGWEDPLFSPIQSIEYLDKTARLSGLDTNGFIKAFFAPAMGHCGGGSGPNQFDALTALQAWVEKGQVPERIIATQYAHDDPGKASVRTRPLCPYPKQARYLGTGDINKAENFVCRSVEK